MLNCTLPTDKGVDVKSRTSGGGKAKMIDLNDQFKENQSHVRKMIQ